MVGDLIVEPSSFSAVTLNDQLLFWSEFARVDGEEFEGRFAVSVTDGRKARLPGGLT